MLSFGSAAYLANKTLIGTFSANLELLEGAGEYDKTMKWWQTQPEAWQACRENLQSPKDAMKKYMDWFELLRANKLLKSSPCRFIFVAYPIGFDFMFIYWYLMKFTGESPFKDYGIDIRTYAMAMMKSKYRFTEKRDMPQHWFDKLPHTHKALDDALAQGALFCNMLTENMKTHR